MTWKDIKQIVEKCVKLKEICLRLDGSSHDEGIYFVNHLPLKIEKLHLFFHNSVSDDFVSALVTRCKHLKSLNLRCEYGMTDDSVTHIINHLKYSLEELE